MNYQTKLNRFGKLNNIKPKLPIELLMSPRTHSTVSTQCPFCSMRFDVRSDAFYLHVALVHIPRLVNDAQESKVRCAINSCGENTKVKVVSDHHAIERNFSAFEYTDRVEQLQGR